MSYDYWGYLTHCVSVNHHEKVFENTCYFDKSLKKFDVLRINSGIFQKMLVLTGIISSPVICTSELLCNRNYFYMFEPFLNEYIV